MMCRYAKEFDDLLQRPPTDESRDKDLEILLSFYTEDVMRAAEREVPSSDSKVHTEEPSRLPARPHACSLMEALAGILILFAKLMDPHRWTDGWPASVVALPCLALSCPALPFVLVGLAVVYVMCCRM